MYYCSNNFALVDFQNSQRNSKLACVEARVFCVHVQNTNDFFCGVRAWWMKACHFNLSPSGSGLDCECH